jgi:UMF1 family MFS transporter
LFRLGPIALHAESYPSFVVTLAALGQLAVLPWLGAAADRRRSRRPLLVASCVVGSLLAFGLAATSGSEWVAAGALFVVGSASYGASNVLYNSYLPELPGERDAVSGRGFVYGYLGGGLLLAADLALLVDHHAVGIAKETAARICFASAGLWWLAFGLWSIAMLGPGRPGGLQTGVRDALDHLRHAPQTRRFVLAYLLFSDAISAVLALSSTFITHELYGDDATRASTFLFALILLIQVVAMAGAAGWTAIARRIGAHRALLASLLVWSAVIVFTYAALRDKTEAVVAGVVIGTVLGGSQALARSLFSGLVPEGREASFFGLYEVANEGSAWLAPLLFTVVVNVTGSYRQAILSLLVLFVAGGLLLARTDLTVAAAERDRTGPLA